jgi:hypothetical protein
MKASPGREDRLSYERVLDYRRDGLLLSKKVPVSGYGKFYVL